MGHYKLKDFRPQNIYVPSNEWLNGDKTGFIFKDGELVEFKVQKIFFKIEIVQHYIAPYDYKTFKPWIQILTADGGTMDCDLEYFYFWETREDFLNRPMDMKVKGTDKRFNSKNEEDTIWFTHLYLFEKLNDSCHKFFGKPLGRINEYRSSRGDERWEVKRFFWNEKIGNVDVLDIEIGKTIYFDDEYEVVFTKEQADAIETIFVNTYTSEKDCRENATLKVCTFGKKGGKETKTKKLSIVFGVAYELDESEIEKIKEILNS